jgi:hypothetical protein
MGPNYVPGSKKDLYVKVRLHWQSNIVDMQLQCAAGSSATVMFLLV